METSRTSQAKPSDGISIYGGVEVSSELCAAVQLKASYPEQSYDFYLFIST